MTKVKPVTAKSEEKLAVSAGKKDIKPKLVSAEAIKAPFTMNQWHPKALLKLLACHHNNDQSLTYVELSAEIGSGEKSKAWQCVAWKDLKSNEYIIQAAEKGKWKLSEKGVKLASTMASPEELADYKMPETNEEHHEKIKSKLMRNPKAKKYGPKIFDFLLTIKTPLNRNEIAAHFDVDADSHGFFYGLSTLKKMGLVQFAKNVPMKKGEKGKKSAVSEETENDKDLEEGEIDENEEEQTGNKKKKKSKAKKNKTGGKPLELAEAAFLATVGRN